MATVEYIVKQHLIANGFDGLHNDDCSCTLEDFMPCEDEWIRYCEPGYKVPCDCGEECAFHIVENKRNP
jgi:hypothetical protein